MNRARIPERAIAVANLPSTTTQLTTRTLQDQVHAIVAIVANDGARSAACKVVPLLGHTVLLGANVVTTEHNRRLTAGIGALPNEALLHALFQMPEDRFCDWSSFDHHARRELFGAAAGIVEQTACGVRRLATYPVNNLAVVLAGANSGSLLRTAGDFAAFSQRWICCPADGNPETELEASLYRVGVIRVDEDGHATETCDPPPFVPARFTPTLWWFHELAYQALLDADAFSAPTP